MFILKLAGIVAISWIFGRYVAPWLFYLIFLFGTDRDSFSRLRFR